ncbi:glycine zipper domain-containing protein, partial [Pseudomonas viridiflava]
MKYSSILLLSLTLTTGFASAGDNVTAGVGGALGGVLGSVVGQQLGGSTGSAIGAGVGGAAGGAVGANRHNRTEAAIGG